MLIAAMGLGVGAACSSSAPPAIGSASTSDAGAAGSKPGQQGSLGGMCYANGTCDDSWQCVSGYCVVAGGSGGAGDSGTGGVTQGGAGQAGASAGVAGQVAGQGG